METSNLEELVKRHDNALFGWWESITNIRKHGLIEKAESAHARAILVEKRVKQVERIQHGMMLLMVFPILQAMGLPTQELAPFVVKFAAKLLGAI